MEQLDREIKPNVEYGASLKKKISFDVHMASLCCRSLMRQINWKKKLYCAAFNDFAGNFSALPFDAAPQHLQY